MAIRFAEIHPSSDPEALNTEWLILENTGSTPFQTRGCGMTAAFEVLRNK